MLNLYDMKKVPEYNVGDYVTVRKTYHPGCNEGDYMFNFTDLMIGEYGGKRFRISSKKRNFSDTFRGKAPYGGFEYSLEGRGFAWSSYMFEESGDWREPCDSKPSEGELKYGGEIADFPREVVEKMLERQYEQTGKRDVSVFERDERCGRFWGGFTWSDTIEGDDFWNAVIGLKAFYIFFKRYPKLERTQENPMLDPLAHKIILKATKDSTEACIAAYTRDADAPSVDPTPIESPKTSIYRRKKGFVPFGKVSKIRPVENVLHKKSK